MIEIYITPSTKPRMTRSDKWKVPARPAVAKYWLYKDRLNIAVKGLKFILPSYGYWLIFYIPMPKSWSEKKKVEMEGKPNIQTPDKDNLEKAFLDALYDSDSKFWDGRVTKLWARTGKICIKTLKLEYAKTLGEEMYL